LGHSPDSQYIGIDELSSYGVTDVTAFSPTVWRFRFGHERRSALQRFIDLEEPALVRETAEANWLRGARYRLEQALDPWVSERPRHRLWISTVSEFLDLLRAHYARPTWIFTNGRSCVSYAVVRGRLPREPRERVGTLALYPSLQAYLDLSSGDVYALQPSQVEICSDEQEAEIGAWQFLSRVSVQTVTLARGAERTTALFFEMTSHADRARGHHAYMAYVSAGPVRLCDRPYRMLNVFSADGFRVHACATCRYFRFSAMSREASGDESGYCMISSMNPAAVDRADPAGEHVAACVSVFDCCRHYEFIEDSDRHPPVLLSPEQRIEWLKARRATRDLMP